MRSLMIAGLAAGLTFGGAMSASATLIDFTDPATYTPPVGVTEPTATGTVGAFSFTITPTPDDDRLTFTTPGPAPGAATFTPAQGPGASALEGDIDGIGVVSPPAIDDEISGPLGEAVTIDFGGPVIITGLYFLDLFVDRTAFDDEQALIYRGTSTADPLLGIIPAFEVQGADPLGALYADRRFVGSAFTFAAAVGNDGVGVGDYALAGLEVAPIPLPAGACRFFPS